MPASVSRGVVAAVALAVALPLGACSSSPAENTAAACSALQDYQSSLEAFGKALTPDMTVDQLKTAKDNVKSATEKLDAAVGSVESDRVKALDQAWKSLSDTVDGLAGDSSVASATSSIKTEVQKVQQARTDLDSAIKCG